MSEEVFEEYPRLLMLDECDGEIDGRLKYHKLLFKYRNQEGINWNFRREEHGPFDEGFSSVFDSFEKIGLTEAEEEYKHKFVLTRDGKRFVEGLKGVWRALDEKVAEKLDTIRDIAAENKDRTGSEIEQDEEIQEVKENKVIQENIETE